MWSPSTERPTARRLLLALLAALLAGCAAQKSANVRETYNTSETGDDTQTSFSNLVEIGIADQLGPDLEYRFSDRIIDSWVELESEDTKLEEDRFLHQPSFDTEMSFGLLTWTQGLELQESTRDPSVGPSNTLLRKDILEKLEWTPVDLPRVTAWFDTRSQRDDEFIDRQDDEFFLQVDDAVGPYSWMYSLEKEWLDDNESGIERDRTDQTGRGTYTDTHLDGRLTTSVSVFVEDERSTTKIPPGGAGALPPEILPVPNGGSSDIDTTPEISTLTPNPALIDGDELTPAGPNIGGFASGGELDWNMALQLPAGSTTGLLLLNTSAEVDPFFADQFNFAVYSSDDGNFWTLVTSSAAFSYEEPLLRFRILIPEVTAEHIKVVNTASPPAAPAVLVTEMRAFESGPAAAPGSSSRLEDKTRSLTSRISYLATETLTLGYDLTLRTLERVTAGTTTRDEDRIDNGLSALWSPSDIVDVNLRLNDQDIDDDVLQDEDFRLLTGLIDVRPLETLDLALSYSDTERDVDGESTLDTESVKARAAAELLPTLQAEVSVEQNTQQDYQADREIDRMIYGASLLAEVTPAWDVTVSLRQEDADVSGSGADLIPDPSEDSYGLLVVYQPSDQLTAEVDLEWKDSFVGSGLDQRLRLDWIPFPAGAIDIQFDVQRLVSGDIDTQIDRYLLLTRYTFNPRAFLELNYSIQEPEDAERTELLTLSLNIEFG